ncbi:hypothetical protein Bca52824_047500 [Brassica carinata]|uniref:Uncharacterized protein n=1 Tax=Brassica carinata TaxID=52824 RepID=A0A8X7US65_BRACI|nr:hypothetical protein Bca52824_047500 [Brassica carinata]
MGTSRRTSASPRIFSGTNLRRQDIPMTHNNASKHGFPHASPIQTTQRRRGTPSGLRQTRPPAPAGTSSEKSGGRERPESSFSAFRTFLSSCDLFDIKHTRNFLSWRGRRSTHLVHCRLDRAMANSAWSDMFPNGRSYYLQFESSDHMPVISTFDSKKKKPSRLFRYDRRLCDNPEIKLLVDATWTSRSHLTVAERISRCRHAIASWSKISYVNSQKKIVELKAALDQAMAETLIDDSSISSLNRDLLQAYKAEEELWK